MSHGANLVSGDPVQPERPFGLRPLVNAAGYQTRTGAAPVDRFIASAAASVLPLAVDMEEFQDIASRAIAEATGAQAGLVTACAAAGITVSVAATMTGTDHERVRQLPDTTGLKNEVVMAAGHECDFGAPVSQMIRLSGAAVASAGNGRRCSLENLEAQMSPRTAALVYVISDHVDPASAPPLDKVCALARRNDVPVIADCAAEDDLVAPVAAGADLAIFSAHKVRRGLTAGIVAGSRDLVAACRLHSCGIGRPMKVGKEGIASTIAALNRWPRLNHDEIHAQWRARSELVVQQLWDIPGLEAGVVDDRNGNPVARARVRLATRDAPGDLVRLVGSLAASSPSIVVREIDDESDAFLVDPRSLSDEEAQLVATRIARWFRSSAPA